MLARIFIILCLVGYVPETTGQMDTIFLNRNFKPIPKGNHDYYRIIQAKSKSKNYIIKDYFNNGKLQMYGISEGPDDKHLIGRVVRYKLDGTIESICDHKSYSDGWISFYNKESIKTAALWCVNNKKHGKATFYNIDGSVFSTGTFKNNSPYSGKIPVMMDLHGRNRSSYYLYKKGKNNTIVNLYKNGNKAAIVKIKDDNDPIEAEYYFNNKEKAGEGTFMQGEPHNGIHLEFADKLLFSYNPSMIKYRSEYDSGQIMWRESYLNNIQIGHCTFRADYPYDGILLDENQIFTYSKGRNMGINQLIYKGKTYYTFVVDSITGLKDGICTFVHPRDTVKYQGTYKDDRPQNGYIYESGNIAHYLDGIKTGISTEYDSNFDTTSVREYLNDLKDGYEKNYQYRRKGVIVGINKDGQPYNGNFLYSERSYVIKTYKDGTALSYEEYNKDSLVLLKYEDLSDTGRVVQYRNDRSLWYQGIKKNGKYYDGQFIKGRELLSYKNGKLNGEKIEHDRELMKVFKIENYENDTLYGYYKHIDYNGKVLSEGNYNRGKPNQGFFLVGSETIKYKNGMRNGLATVLDHNFISKTPYHDNAKHGKAEFRVISKSLDSILYLLDSAAYYKVGDTVVMNLEYISGKPVSGIDVTKTTLSSYRNGLLSGLVITWNNTITNTNKPSSIYTYKDGLLNGLSKMFLKELTLESNYENGKLLNGFELIKIKDPYQNIELLEFKDGIQQENSKYAQTNYSSIYIKNGSPYDGVYMKNPNNPYLYKYKNGVLLKSYLYANMSNDYTIYDGLSSTTYDRDNNILHRTKYTDKSYTAGNVIIDGKKGYEFENGYLSKGCVVFDNISNNFFNQLDLIEVCQSDSITSIAKKKTNNSIYTIDYIYTKEYLQIPAHMNMAFIYSIENQYDIKSKTSTYLSDNNRILTTYSRIDGIKTGNFVEQDKNLFKYFNFDKNTEEILTFEEFLQKLNISR